MVILRGFSPLLDLRHFSYSHNDKDVQHGDNEHGHDPEDQSLDHVGHRELHLPVEAHDADGELLVKSYHYEVVGSNDDDNSQQ